MDVGSLLNMMPLLIAGVAIGIVLLAVVIIAIVMASMRKRLGAASAAMSEANALLTPNMFSQLGRAMAAGEPSALQVEVERIGWIGEAMVLDRNDLETVAKNNIMVYHRAALVLEVRLPNAAPYRAPCEQWVISSHWRFVEQGEVVPVRVDPRNPQIVFVDMAARDRAAENVEAQEREAHARRQAELLGQNRH